MNTCQKSAMCSDRGKRIVVNDLRELSAPWTHCQAGDPGHQAFRAVEFAILHTLRFRILYSIGMVTAAPANIAPKSIHVGRIQMQ